MPQDASESVEAKPGQPETATEKETPKSEPLVVLKVSEYDKESGQKTQVDKPVYTIEELIEDAQKGVSFDSKNAALNALIRNEAAKIVGAVGKADFPSEARGEVERQVAEIERDLPEIKDTELDEVSDPAVANVLRKALGQIKQVSDAVLDHQIKDTEEKEFYTAYNKEIGVALASNPKVTEQILVPFVRENLLPNRASPKLIGAVASLLQGFAERGMDINKMSAEQKQAFVEKLKPQKPIPAAPPTGGIQPPSATASEKVPENFSELSEVVDAFTKKWVEGRKE